VDQTPWTQVNITYPGSDPRQRERHAIDHLARVLPAAEADGHLSSWWFIRKGPWRVRYLLTSGAIDKDPVQPLLTNGQADVVAWSHDVYEPEVHAFGGPASMDTAHTLFHHDCRHLLAFLNGSPHDRRERSLILCTALMRSAGLDLNEQGDVWARVAEQRAGVPHQPPAPDPNVWATFSSGVRHLLLGTARAEAMMTDWIAAFEDAGMKLRAFREGGELTRGIRAVIAVHVIFHWNRIGLGAVTQATLARVASDAVFSPGPPLNEGTSPLGKLDGRRC
jgi:thiopeptide-type bacteriocin biosynthesis protein